MLDWNHDIYRPFFESIAREFPLFKFLYSLMVFK